VQQIWRYPVKSMGGEQLQEAEVAPTGVAGDRRFVVIDASTGMIATAKRPRWWGGLLELWARAEGDDRAVVTFPDGGAYATDDPELVTRLSDHLGRAVTIASSAPDGTVYEEVWDRAKNDSPLYAKQIGTDEGQPVVSLSPSPIAPKGTFFDFSAVHLVTTSALAALQSAHATGQVDVRRFRPNLVVEVPDEFGFAENDWADATFEVGVGGLCLKGLMPTMRCVMTTVAQPDLARDPGILQAVNGANRITVKGMGDYACLGLYCMVTAAGPAAVGDAITVR
jgi:hypothetical protein